MIYTTMVNILHDDNTYTTSVETGVSFSVIKETIFHIVSKLNDATLIFKKSIPIHFIKNDTIEIPFEISLKERRIKNADGKLYRIFDLSEKERTFTVKINSENINELFVLRKNDIIDLNGIKIEWINDNPSIKIL